MSIFSKLSELKDKIDAIDTDATVEKLKELPEELKVKFADELAVVVAAGEFIETLTNDKADSKIEKILTHLR